MGIDPALLLERMAGTLRAEVGPAVGDEFARTQVFMGAVVLAKLAGQLRAAPADAAAAAAEHGRVAVAVRAVVPDPPPSLAMALDALASDGATSRWNDVVAGLYAARDAIGDAVFADALGVVRDALRVRLDRELRYAR